ncbi:hypothetical protein C8255_26060 [filamentous cyanobacterium CCP3]|nr:hypothetical protein C8255_26060 [filamentous cyanobacterium CCP3]
MDIKMLLPGCRLSPSGSRAVALALSAGLSAFGRTDGQAAWSSSYAGQGAADRQVEVMAQAPDLNPVLLQPGAEGDEVIMLQRQMRLLGLYEGPVNGRYEEATERAIAAFQTSVGLPDTGTLDQATWQRMSNPQLLANDAPAAAAQPVLLPDAEAAAEPSSELPSSSLAAIAKPPEVTRTESPEPANPPSRTRRVGWLAVGGLALAVCLGGWLWLGKGKKRFRSDDLAPAPPTNLPPDLDPAEATAAPAFPSLQSAPAATDLPLEATTRLSRVDMVDSLVHELDSADSAVRRHAIWELGQRGYSDVIQPLINGLLEADSQEKSLILAALAEISSRSLKPMHRALALGLQDPSPEVRKNAIRDLSRVHDTVVQLSHMLAHATQDPDPGVQETAQWALSQLNRIPAASYAEAHPPEPTVLESSYDGQQTTSEGHRLSPPHS